MHISHDETIPARTGTGSVKEKDQARQLSKLIDQSSSSSSQLRIPSYQQRRRSSLDSTFTELSELSILSNDYSETPLSRKISHTSDVSGYSVYSAYSATTKKSFRQRLADFYDQNYGALLVLLSQFFGSLMNIFTRLLEHEGPHGAPMHPFQILFVRQSLTAVLCTIYALTTKSIPHFPLGPPDRQVRLLLICRGLTGFFGVFGMYFSLLYLPLSEATVLTFLAPILACYLCTYIIPGETFTRQQQIAGFVSLIGVIFIAQPLSLFQSAASSSPSTSTGMEAGLPQPSLLANTTAPSASEPKHHFVATPPTPSQHLLAIAIAMLGVCGATGAITSIRAIGTRAHAFISINYFSVWSSIVSLVALLVIPSVSFRLPSNLIEWCLLFSLGTCGFIMQGLLTMGLAYKATGKGGGSGQPKVERSTPDDDHVRHKQPESTVQDIELSLRSTMAASASSSSADPNLNSIDNSNRQRKPRLVQSKKPSSSGTKATSMLYTQMLFALAGDRVVFGSTPGVWSWIGSGLILAGAIWVASARDKPAVPVKEQPDLHEPSHGPPGNNSEGKEPEERIGLLHDTDHEPVQDEPDSVR